MQTREKSTKDLYVQKSSEEKLNESEARYKALVERTPFLQVCRWKPDSTLIYINQEYAETFGIDKDNLNGKKWLDFLPAETRLDIAAKLKEQAKNPQSISYEHDVIDKDGDVKFFLWIDTPIFNLHGELIEFQSVGRDITDRKKAEDEIKRLNKTLESKISERTKELELAYRDMESFGYSISHDLKSPLRNLLITAQIISRNTNELISTRDKQLLDDIISSSGKMQTLVDSLLNFSRMGSRVLKIQHVDAESIISEIVSLQKQQYKQKKTTIELGEIHPIAADQTLIYQVFQNLIENAFKYSAENEHIKIEINSAKRENDILFSIKDNGVGFDPLLKAKLFEPFKRLHSEERFPGIGIGLAITRRIIEKHKGQIWAESCLNEGSTFYFTLQK